MPDDNQVGTPGGDTGSGSAVGVASPTPVSASLSSSVGTIIPQGADSVSTPGPVPYERFSEVNEKYNSLKWAESHNPQLVDQQAQFFRWLDTDPVGAHNYLTDYLSRAGVLQRPQNGEDRRPQPLVVPETGQKFYTADHVDQLIDQAVKKAIGERVAPLEGTIQEGRARAEARAQIAQAESLPYFKEHESDILKTMEADQRLSLEGAYNRIVLPKIRTLERQAVLKEMNEKPHATTVNPGSTVTSERVPLHKLSFQELLKREMSKRGNR